MNFKEFKNKYEKESVEHYPTNVQEKPLVSVCVQTYQHAVYIEDCLEGILMQEMDFPIEILVGEDSSTDGTRDICISYANKYPDKIRLFLHKRENNIKIEEQATGRFNFLYNLYSANGKYIAFCEGDDYWTDSLKLQKQVEIIERKNYSGVAHNARIKFEDEDQPSKLFRKKTGDKVLNLKDLIEDRPFHTASILFKSDALNLENFTTKIVSADRYLYQMLATEAPIFYLDEVMCCYRRNQGGISRNVSDEMLKNDLLIPEYLKEINNSFPKYRSLSFVHYTIANYSTEITILNYLKHSFIYIFYSFSKFPYNLRDLSIYFLKSMPSKIIKLLKSNT
ncbi:MAG: glycosyltransferase family 2 protein [Bacteroidota bacterium]